MELNADFSRRVSIHSDALPWTPSPMAGVDRRMLDRIGDEVARATSIVRYAPGSMFSPHVHTGGEEFLVLEGTFEDEHGAFPAGSYIRNPPGSRHTPGSRPGCVLFVKLWQFDLADRTHVRMDTGKMRPVPVRGRPGVSVTPLFDDGREDVRIEHWEPGACVTMDLPGGAELLVLEGGFEQAGEGFGPRSWLRLPVGHALEAMSLPEGARVWVKSGHLPHARAPQLD
jgi:quercetin dioxygenase-like cupin family protein